MINALPLFIVETEFVVIGVVALYVAIYNPLEI
jgi:hypothetical protein